MNQIQDMILMMLTRKATQCKPLCSLYSQSITPIPCVHWSTSSIPIPCIFSTKPYYFFFLLSKIHEYYPHVLNSCIATFPIIYLAIPKKKGLDSLSSPFSLRLLCWINLPCSSGFYQYT